LRVDDPRRHASRHRNFDSWSWQHLRRESAHQIDQAEDGDPDDVERVPEEREAEKPQADVLAKAFCAKLSHHRGEPDQSGRDVRSVTADEREEGGEESAAGRAGAVSYETGELPCLEQDESKAEKSGYQESDLRPFQASPGYREARHSAGECRGEQAAGLNGDIAQIE